MLIVFLAFVADVRDMIFTSTLSKAFFKSINMPHEYNFLFIT